LDRDVVFLSEILTELGNDSKKETWDNSYSGINCFKLPLVENIPKSLKYSADVNVFLANLKLNDDIQ
jgi:hypothetical protein